MSSPSVSNFVLESHITMRNLDFVLRDLYSKKRVQRGSVDCVCRRSRYVFVNLNRTNFAYLLAKAYRKNKLILLFCNVFVVILCCSALALLSKNEFV